VDDLRERLPGHQPRFVVYCYRMEHSDGRVSYPMCFIYITPRGKTKLTSCLSFCSSVPDLSKAHKQYLIKKKRKNHCQCSMYSKLPITKCAMLGMSNGVTRKLHLLFGPLVHIP
jgi:hypothetical protein